MPTSTLKCGICHSPDTAQPEYARPFCNNCGATQVLGRWFAMDESNKPIRDMPHTKQCECGSTRILTLPYKLPECLECGAKCFYGKWFLTHDKGNRDGKDV